jgi:hypothetical protein
LFDKIGLFRMPRQLTVGIGGAVQITAEQQFFGGAFRCARLVIRRGGWWRLRALAIAQPEDAFVDACLGELRVPIAREPPTGGRQRVHEHQLERMELDFADAV